MTTDAAPLAEGSFGRARTPDGDRVVIVSADGFRVAEVDGRAFDDLPDLLDAAGGDLARITAGSPVSGGLLAPLARPRKIICIGQNYIDHVKEFGGTKGPAHPDLFAKWATALAGPDTDILLPAESEQIDFEAELALVVGRGGRRIAEQDAADAIFGYTAANDGSVRDFQRHTTQRTAGKAWDGLTPIGPVVVPAGRLGGASPDLAITSRLNGEVMQNDRTSSLTFGIPTLIAYISTVLTLEPGDIILTGTPSGVGGARTPAVYLRPGDTFEVEIEGVGTLRNRYVAAD